MTALMSGDREDAKAQAAVTAFIEGHGGFASAAAAAQEHVSAAVRELEIFASNPATQEPAGLLRELAGYVLVRKK